MNTVNVIAESDLSYVEEGTPVYRRKGWSGPMERGNADGFLRMKAIRLVSPVAEAPLSADATVEATLNPAAPASSEPQVSDPRELPVRRPVLSLGSKHKKGRR